MKNETEMDELLEKIWTEREKGNEVHEETNPCLKQLEERRLLSLSGGRMELTPAGEKEAERIIRRHRLTERLFADVLNTREEIWEQEACELEHPAVLTEEAVNAICAFLGHPPTCPHGRPIPPGPCCKEFHLEVKAFVIPLSEAQLSSRYRIVFITPKGGLRLDRLAVLGILPGSEIRIHQKGPAYVIRTGETDVALDKEIAKDIYVREAL